MVVSLCLRMDNQMKVSDLAKKTIKKQLPKQYKENTKQLTHQLRKTSTKRCRIW